MHDRRPTKKGTSISWHAPSPKNPQQASVSFLETLNLKIHRAYLLKESFRDFWQ